MRTFGTTTAELMSLHDWLAAHQATHVAMESTGVYWKLVYYALEDTFTLILVNPAHMRNVPGQKTDVQDCVWIAQLLEWGAAGQLRAPTGNSKPPRPDPLSQESHSGTDPYGQPAAQSPAGCGVEAGLRRQ